MAALISGAAVAYYMKMREATRRRALEGRIAELTALEEEQRRDLDSSRAEGDARGRLLGSLLGELMPEVIKLRQGAEIADIIDPFSAPIALPARLEDRAQKLLERVGLFRSRGIPVAAPLAFNLALLQYAGGRRHEAEERFQEALISDPAHQEARLNLGNLALKERRFAEARAHFETLLELAAHSFEGHFGLGVALTNLGQAEAAVAAFTMAIRLRPEHAETYCRLGEAYIVAGDLERALESAKVAIKLSPEMAEGRLLLQRILIKSGNFHEAIEACHKTLKQRDDPRALYNLAVARAMSGDRDLALDALRQAVSKDGELRYAAKDEQAFAGLRDSRRFKNIIEGRLGLF